MMNKAEKKSQPLKDIGQIILFLILVYIGATLVNTFIFRSFTVSGSSMENTFSNGDRLIVERVSSTVAGIKNEQYTPNRNDIIVFKNPQYVAGVEELYVVKRVIAFAGERVVVKDGKITVYNQSNPKGFDPDKTRSNGTPTAPISGYFDGTVPENNLFVVGDNRKGRNSCDSRGCLGFVPSFNVIGPVKLKIWPLHHFGTY